MTPKEKAIELRDKMYLRIPAVYDPTGIPHFPMATEMALIAVDEIIKVLYDANDTDEEYGYWTDVKQELIQL